MNVTSSFTLIKRRLQRMVALQNEAPDGSHPSTLAAAATDSAPTMDNSGSAPDLGPLAPGLETQQDAFAGLGAWWHQLRAPAVNASGGDEPAVVTASSTEQPGVSSATAGQTAARAVDLLVASIWQELQAAATDGRLESIWSQMYGETVAESQAAQNLLTSLQLGQGLPLVVRLLNNETIQSAFAAYTHSGADGLETIYLNQDWLQFASFDEVAAKLIEEIGHALDLRLTNGGDGSGDEGEEFSLRFAGRPLSSAEQIDLRQQDDHGTLTVDGQLVNVEFATVARSNVGYTEDSATYADIFSQDATTSTFTGSSTVNTFKVTVTNTIVTSGTPQDYLYFHPTNSELTTLTSGQIGLPLGKASSSQALSSNANITYATTLSGNTTTIIFTFNSSVAAADRQAFKNQFSKTLAFATTSQDPTVPASTRIVSLFDNGTSTLVTKFNTITVTGVDDAPSLLTDKGSRSFLEGSGASVQGSEVVVFAGVTADPVESVHTISSFKVSISGLKDGNQEQIAFNGGSFISLGGDTSGTTSISSVAFSWSYLASTGLLSFAKSGTTGLNKSQAKAFFESIRYKNTRIDNPTSGDRQFVISEIVDSGSSTGSNKNTTTDSLSPTSLTQTTISVVATNDRPVLTAFTPVFPATKSTVSSASNPGILVSDLIANAVISDLDVVTAARAIYITSVDNSTGSWQYLADPSVATSWTTISFDGPNAGLMLLLGSSDKIRFQPNASSLGTYGLTFGAWDQSNVATAPARTYQAADTSVTSPYSSLTVGGSVTVVSNGLPVYKSSGSTVDGALTETVGTPASGAQLVSTGLIGFTDSDAGDTHTATIISSPSGQLGALSLGQVDQANRQVAWTYNLPANSVESLAAGQTLTQTYVVAIADSDGASFAQSITLAITGTNDAPVVTSAAGSLSGSVIEAGSSGNGTPSVTGTLSASDVDAGATQTWSIQGTPSTTYGSVAINATTGVWSYTLDNTAAATQALKQGGSVTQSYTARVTDELGASADQTITLLITGANDTPVVTNAAGARSGSVTEAGSSGNGTASVSGTLSASDVDAGASQTWSIQGTPSTTYGSVAINATTGVWSYTLDNTKAATQGLKQGESVTESYTARVSDEFGASADQTISVLITGANDAPVVFSSTAITGEKGVLSSSVPAATDVDGTIASYSLVSGIGSGSGSLTFNSNGSFSFDPGSAFQGLGDGESRTVSFTYLATDNNGANSASQTVSITVTGTNDVATLSSDSRSLSETNAVLTTSGTLTVTDLDAIPATVVPQTNASGSYGTFSITSAGAWTYATASALNSLNAGQVVSDVFSVATTDGGSAAVTVTITGTNDVATLSSDSRSLSETNAVLTTSGTLSVTDLDATAAAVVAQPNTTGSYGTFSITSAGEWTYATASALNSLNAGQVVSDVFSVATTDGGSASVTVSITGTNDVATLSSDSRSLTETNSVLTTSGTLSVTDLDATAATVVAQTNASGSYGTFSIDSAGAWTYSTASALNSLNAGQVVSDVFSVATTDGGTASVTVTITGTNDAATLSSDSQSLTETNAALSTSGSLSLTDFDATAATVLAQTNASGSYGTFSINSAGEWTYSTASALNSLNAGQVVSDVFSVATTDGGSAAVTVTITGTNDVATLSSDSRSLSETNAALSTSGTLSVTDLDATAATVVAQTNAAGSYGTFSIDSAGEWTYSTASALNSLNAGQVVNDVFSVSTTDGGSAAVTVSITGTNDVATLSSDSQSLTETNAVLTTSATLSVTDLDATAATVVAQTNASGSYGTFSIDSAGAWTYSTASALNSLNAGQVVSDVFSVATTDGGSAAVTVSITGSNDAPVAFGDLQATSIVAILNSSVPNATDVDGTISSYTLINGVGSGNGSLTFNADGSYSFNPGSDFDGLGRGSSRTVSFTYNATDNNGANSASQTVTIEVTGVNNTPIAYSGSGTTGENAILSSSVPAATDPDGTISSYSLVNSTGSGNGSLTFNPNGSYVFDPGSDFDALGDGDSRTVSFTYIATDNSGADSASHTVTITVTGSNDVATLSGDSRSLTETNAVLTTSGTLSVTDLDATAATVVAQPDTAGSYGTFSITSAGAWTYSTASALNSLNAGQVVSDVFSVATTDGGTAAVTVSITGTNDVATLSSDSRSLSETNAALSTSGSLSLTDLDATAATVVAQTNASGSYGTFSINSAGEWTYATASALNSLNAGQVVNDVFSVSTTDGGSAAVTVTITGTDDVATLSSDSRSLSETNAVLTTSGTLSVTDLDATAAAVVAQTNAPGSYGTFSINSAGAWTYSTASALNSLNAGQVVSDVFSVATTDGSTASVTVTITGSNDVATLSSDSRSLTETNAALSTSGTLSVTDLDATAATVAAQTNAAGSYGTFSINSAGAWTYSTASALNSLNAGQVVSDVFSVATTDGGSAAVTVSITGCNDAPVATYNSVFQVVEDGPIITGQITSTDPDAGSIRTYALVGAAIDGFSLNSNGNWSFNPAAATYQPLAAGSTQAVLVNYRVTDDAGATDTGTFQITVTGAFDPPSIAPITSGSISEVSQSSTITSSNLTGTAVAVGFEAANTINFSISGGTATVSGDPAGFTTKLASTYGTLYLNGSTGAYQYIANTAAVDALDTGETASQSFTITAANNLGASASTTYAINITGADDAPVLAVIASGAISEITGSSATTTSGVSGVLQGTDVDIEPLTYGILGSASGSYGTLSVNSSTGSYLYTPIAANVEKLAAGVVVSDTFTFTVTDGDDTVVSRPFSVSITGANDAPTITQPIADFSFIEALDAVSQSLSSAGTISFSDVDNGAILGVSYALTAGATWNLSGGGTGSLSSALKTSLENGFAISGSNLSSPNSANWTYSASGLNLDFLAVGDSITWTYSVNVTDSLGATASDLVTITIQGTNEPLVIESSGTTTVAASGPHPLEFKNVTSADVSIMVSAAVAVVSDTFATRTGAKLNASTSGWGVDNQNFDYFNNAPTGSIGSEDTAEVIEVAFTDYDASINYTALSGKADNDFRAGTYQRPVPFMPGSGSASQGQLVYKPVDGFGFDVSKLTAGSAADFLIGATYLFSNGTTQTLRYQFSNVSVPATPIPRIYVGLDPVTGASTALSWLDADNDSKPDLNETANGTVTALNTFTNPGSATLLGIISTDTINNEVLVNNTLAVESFNVTNPRFYDLL